MAHAGSIAGSKDEARIRVSVDNVAYPAHKLIWKMVTGQDPLVLIDHADRNFTNNRWTNLREATYSENNGNIRRPRHNTVGLKGVCKYRGKFMAQCGGKYLGLFLTPEEAHAAYVAAAKLHFGPFSNPG
jgi:hypothetical protein